MIIEENDVVTMHYRFNDDKGNVIDTSYDEEPMIFIQGKGNLIPGLDTEMLGRKVGDHFQVTVKPEDAYGTFNEAYIQLFPLDAFNQGDKIEVGLKVQLTNQDGQPILASIHAIEEEGVLLNLNHPLVDKTLEFEIEIINTRPATADELERGHMFT